MWKGCVGGGRGGGYIPRCEGCNRWEHDCVVGKRVVQCVLLLIVLMVVTN